MKVKKIVKMNRIFPNKGQDLILEVEFDETISNFVLRFTTDDDTEITISKSELIDGNLVKLNATELSTLSEGILKCYAQIKYADTDFDDDTYDDVQCIQTNYYIKL